MSHLLRYNKNTALNTPDSFTKTSACRQEFKFLCANPCNFMLTSRFDSGWPDAKCWYWWFQTRGEPVCQQCSSSLLSTSVFRWKAELSVATVGDFTPIGLIWCRYLLLIKLNCRNTFESCKPRHFCRKLYIALISGWNRGHLNFIHRFPRNTSEPNPPPITDLSAKIIEPIMAKGSPFLSGIHLFWRLRQSISTTRQIWKQQIGGH